MQARDGSRQVLHDRMERFVKQLDFRARAFHSGTFRHEAALYALQSSAAMRPLDPSPPWLSLEPRAHGTVVCLEGLQQRDRQLSLLDAVLRTATSCLLYTSPSPRD